MNPEHSPEEPALTWTSAPSILFDAPGLTILTYQCAAWSVVRVEGELDLRVGPEVHQALATLSPYLVFDLRHMTFVDASGLRLLTRGHQAARARNGVARVASPSRQVRKVLAILNLDTALQLFDTLSEALLAPLPTVRACDHRVPVLGPGRSPREPRLRMHYGGGHDGQRHRSARRPRIGGG